MTVNNKVPVSGPFLADGVKKDWPFDFKIRDASQMSLSIQNVDGTGRETVTTGFTIAPEYIDRQDGGYVIYPASGAALPTGKEVYAVRVVPYSQPTRIGNQGKFYPQTHEDALDNLSMQIQQVYDLADRSLRAAVGGSGLELAANIPDGSVLVKVGDTLIAGPLGGEIVNAQEYALAAKAWRDQSQTFATNSSTSAGQALTYRNAAQTWAETAEAWAISMDTPGGVGFSAKYWAGRAAQAGGVPVGTIIDVFGNGTTTPAGYLKLVPGLEITDVYPELKAWAIANGWTVNGSGNPVFPANSDALVKRGWRPGQTRDAGRVFGTVQLDQLQGHWHDIIVLNTAPGAGSSSGIASANAAGSAQGYAGSSRTPITDGTNGVPRVGAETRMSNITVTWFIKAYDMPIDAATLNAIQVVADLADARNRITSLERKFVSPQQTWVALGSLSLVHGLGAVPGNVITKMVNINAEHGYVPGDTLIVNAADDIGSSYGGASITVDATNVFFRFGNGNYVVAHKTTGARAGCSPANWRLVIEARP